MKFENLIMKKLDIIENKLDKQLILLDKLTTRQEILEDTIKEVSASHKNDSKAVKVVKSLSNMVKGGKGKGTTIKKNKVEEGVK